MARNCFSATDKGKALREELQRSVDRKLRKLAKNTSVPEGLRVTLAMREATAEAKAAKALKDKRDYLRYTALQSAIDRLNAVDQTDVKALQEAALSLYRAGPDRSKNDVESNSRQIIAENNMLLKSLANVRARYFRAGIGFDKQWNDNMFKEAFGISTGDKVARQIAKEMKAALDELNVKARAAGADIPEIDGWFLPQRYNFDDVAKVEQVAWVNELMGKTASGVPILDRSKFRHPDTGAQLMEEDIRELLLNAYESITTQGRNKWDEPTIPGTAGIMNKRAKNRSIHYTPEGYMHVAKAYGIQDVVTAFLEYRDNFAHDISLMQLLGPNPDVMRDSLIASLNHRIKDGRKASSVQNQIEQFHAKAMRTNDIVASHTIAAADQLARKVTSANLLGNVIVASMADIKSQRIKAIVTGSSMFRTLTALMSHMWNSKISAEEALELGLVIDSMLSSTGQAMRHGVDGLTYSNSIADRGMNFVFEKGGMLPWTIAGKLAAVDSSAAKMARELGKSWDKLPALRQAYYTAVGITPDQWNNIITKTKPVKRSGLLAADIIHLDAVRKLDRDAFEKLQRRLIWDQDTGVLQPGAKSSAFLGQHINLQRGTLGAVGWNQIKMFKSFMFAQWSSLLDVFRNPHLPMRTKVRAVAEFAIWGTIMGATVMQIKQYMNGKDPLPMDNWQFWLSAAIAGGTVPVIGDIIFPILTGKDNFYSETDQAKKWYDILPTVGLAYRSLGPYGEALIDLFSGDMKAARENAGEGTTETLRTATGALGLRTIGLQQFLDHAFWPMIEDALAPETYRKRRKNREKYAREMGTDYWWKPGDAIPSRMPRLP